MEQQEKTICEGCHEREATHHSTISCGERTEERHLCAECFEALASPEQLAEHRRTLEIVTRGKCKYCGEPAVSGSGFLSGSGAEEWDLWCEPCGLDLAEFARRPENAIPDFDAEDEARLDEISETLAERQRRQAEFMRQRVRERMSR